MSQVPGAPSGSQSAGHWSRDKDFFTDWQYTVAGKVLGRVDTEGASHYPAYRTTVDSSWQNARLSFGKLRDAKNWVKEKLAGSPNSLAPSATDLDAKIPVQEEDL